MKIENTINIQRIVPLTVLTVGLLLLILWMSYDPSQKIIENIPGMDGKPSESASREDAARVQIGQFFERLDSNFIETAGVWPRFRGANFDNISTENIRLIDKWDETRPNIIWQKELGEGHAAPAVYNGRVYILDYDEQKKADALRCFSLNDGRELWRRWYNIHLKRNHGMSRTVPAVTDKYVVSIGPKCHVMCCDSKTGDFLWGIDLELDYETKVPFWYTGQCPLIDDSVAVIASGGKALMIGVDCKSGKLLWQTPNPEGWQMSHSSIVPVEIYGKKMYIYCAIGGIVGVSAEKEDRGALLWKSTLWNHSVMAPSPVYIGDNRIFLTAGYGAGSAVIHIKNDGGIYAAELIQQFKPNEGLASEQQTPILFNNYLFCILPKDAGPLRNQFACAHPNDCSKILWSSGKTTRFGLGPFIVADGKFYILNDDGTLTIAKASEKSYQQTGQIKIFDGHDAWGPLIITSGKLLLRDSKQLLCVDLKETS